MIPPDFPHTNSDKPWRDRGKYRGGDGPAPNPLVGGRLLWHVVTTRIPGLVLLNVLVVLGSLPIVTIPRSCRAAAHVCTLMLERRQVFVWHDYVEDFRHPDKRTFLCGWGSFGVVALSVFGVVLYGVAHIAGDGINGTMLAGICGAVGVVGWMAAAYVPSLLLERRLNGVEILRNALILVPVRLPINLVVLLASVSIVAVGVLLAPWSVWVMPTFGCSMIVLLNTWNAREGIQRYVHV